MNREQLERLGEAPLRQMARSVGLRGARHLSRSLLVTGLAAYFSRQPPDDDGPEAPQDVPAGPAGIPPALTTETMARLLESQGETTQARAVRARLVDGDGGAPPPAAVSPSVQVLPVAPDSVELVWEGASSAQAGLVVRLWTQAGDPIQWELPVTRAAGHMRFDPPPHTIRVCVALGRLSSAGFVPVARSPILQLASTTPGDERP